MAVLLFFLLALLFHSSAASLHRNLILVQQQPLVLKYHHGPLLTGNLTLRTLFYGDFPPSHRAILLDFLVSLSSADSSSLSPSVASWWSRTSTYHKPHPLRLSLGASLLDDYSLGKSISAANLLTLAGRGPHRQSLTIVFTSPDVAVEGFCLSRCGFHSSAPVHPNRSSSLLFPYLWVGDSSAQCPGQCAWPFHQPIYGPQTPPLVAPNGDVGVDGMVINLATVLAGAVTNPYRTGFFQGDAEAPLEAVSACTGVFGSGAYPGYPGRVLVERTTGASFNAYGIDGRRYLLPAMWDPATSQCATLV